MQKIFLGGNTCRGFWSFYDGFCDKKDDFLYVIKGGPGCGKSTFMKTVAAFWEEKGYKVLRVFCSGDPDSLDGIYCQARHLGFVDGTAPHCQDVRYMGVSGAYLDFSDVFRLDALKEKRQHIREISDACSAEYQKAYRALRAFSGQEEASQKTPGCFLRAIPCQGLVSFYPADVQSVSKKELELLMQTGCAVIAHPLFPALCEGVFLPNTNAYAFYADARSENALAEACSRVVPILARAKALHDELEALYRPFVDFAQADALARRFIPN